jgi:hypothetical protein
VHAVFNRPIRQDEYQAIDKLFRGQATYAEANFYWWMAMAGYFCLVPFGFVAALLLGRAAPAVPALAILMLPFAGLAYAFVVKSLTAETKKRFKASSLYCLHDLGIVALAFAAALVLQLGL